MEIMALHENLSVCGQICCEDVAQIKKLGFKRVICNRPDGEDTSQTNCALVEKEVRDAGMDFLYLPVNPGYLEYETVQAFANSVAEPGPVLAYCRTGNRCSILWAYSQMGKLATQTIVDSVSALGFQFVPPVQSQE